MAKGQALLSRILIATTNRHKLREIRALVANIDFDVDLLALDAWPQLQAPEETGVTFEENARQKALYYAAATGQAVVAEDSGLEIDALGGAPGVESARYGGIDATYPQKFARIDDAMRRAATTDRSARFVCALAVAHRGHVIFETRAVIEGEIAIAPRGTRGFGYDPIFFYPPYGCTLGEASDAQKAAVSHRAQAFGALIAFLRRTTDPEPGATHGPRPKV